MEEELKALVLALINSFEEQTKTLKVIQDKLTYIESELQRIRPSIPSQTLENTKAYNHLNSLGVAGSFSEFGL